MSWKHRSGGSDNERDVHASAAVFIVSSLRCYEKEGEWLV